jgi:enoyl-CoA hydratase
MTDTTQRHDPAPGVVHLVLDDSSHRNPIDHCVMDVLGSALLEEGAEAVVLSAIDGPVFCSGGDLRLDDEALRALSDRIYALCEAIGSRATVFVVASNGLAVGAGAQLFLAADLRVVGPKARLQAALPDRGLFAGAWTLPALVGRGHALDLLLTGRRLDASALLTWGLADRCDSRPTEAAIELAEQIAATNRDFRLRVKQAVTAGWLQRTALELEQSSFTPPKTLQ